MSARAQERIRAERERERVIEEAEWAAYQAEIEEQYRPQREAGPPGGCHECWEWWGQFPGWWHRDSVQPGPAPGDYPLGRDTPDTDWCYHACHGEGIPVFCGPIAMAAC
jgi:hypothetical protein